MAQIGTDMATTAKAKIGKGATALERSVVRWINDKARDYNNGAEGVLKDLAHGGGSSGMISHLVYTADCVAFYKKHQSEIDALAYEYMRDSGVGAEEMFKDWEATDPFAREDWNMNLLAWFGFEETARRLGDAAGLNN